MNPHQRGKVGDRSDWGRFDAPGHRTVYGAEPVECSYAESLAAQRVASPFPDTRLGDLFAAEPGKTSRRSLLEQVAEEWDERNHMGPGRVSAGWRIDRLLYQLTLPSDGWFVDVCGSDSIAVLNAGMQPQLEALEVSQLTIGGLLGEDRELTTVIAEWLWRQTLDDGSLPHGVSFPSKHGENWSCYAVWLRFLDDGKALHAEPTVSDAGSEIEPLERNEPLKYVAELFNLQCF